MTSYEWYRNVGFRPPERSRLYVDGFPPKYFVKDKCLNAINMHLDDVEKFIGWYTVRVRKVVPGLLPVPEPIRPMHPDITIAMIKEMMGYAKKGHTAEVRENLEKGDPELKEAWDKLRDELTNGKFPFTSVIARMPLDHESVPRPMSSTCDSIYPIRTRILKKT